MAEIGWELNMLKPHGTATDKSVGQQIGPDILQNHLNTGLFTDTPQSQLVTLTAARPFIAYSHVKGNRKLMRFVPLYSFLSFLNILRTFNFRRVDDDHQINYRNLTKTINQMPQISFFFLESPTASVLDEMGGLSWLLDGIYYFHVQNDGRSFKNEGFSECPSRGRRPFWFNQGDRP
ncbi:hypothetical protein CEXT_30811 [Caerostris extrusa]|uniref:Uncharacterized protein n=1 Tax=Caerostris extrusa TaxID=172846 RepID=A0AAV4WQ18_CAEEX|nr:hypothetical protein CEXT_30811 [Caerostris extrusa]